jgi:predicted O-methyltransferase YrrM
MDRARRRGVLVADLIAAYSEVFLAIIAKGTMSQIALAQRVRAFIQSLDRAGSTPFNAGPVQADFRTVTITTGEGEAIREWVMNEKASKTIEIGLAFGFSALHICEGLLLNDTPNPRHVLLDPFQASGYCNRGLEILEEAGVSSLIEFHGERSQLALPQFLKEGREFDLAFVDGNHRFDAVFVDLYFLGQLVRKGGIIILDDYNLPGIQRAASFFVNNLSWKIEETSPPNDEHHWVVLRTSAEEDRRDFRHFAEF